MFEKMTQSLKTTVKVPSRVYQILAIIYAGLSLAGSLLLLKYRKDMVEDETIRQIIFLVGLFWLITNVFLVEGLIFRHATDIKAHLYYMILVLVGIGVTLVVAVLIFLGHFIGYLDREGSDWLEMIQIAGTVGAILMLIVGVAMAVLAVCAASIRCLLTGVIESYKNVEENKYEGLDNKEEKV